MPATIPNLWPQDEVNVETLTPLAILRAQAPLLAQMTKGLLEADITTQTASKGDVLLFFDVIAPALNNYRHRILVCRHGRQMIYPVYFDDNDFKFLDRSPVAFNEGEFESKLREMLQSKSVIAILSSLIARSNEERPATPLNGHDTEESE